jgi:hypothetical protein
MAIAGCGYGAKMRSSWEFLREFLVKTFEACHAESAFQVNWRVAGITP